MGEKFTGKKVDNLRVCFCCCSLLKVLPVLVNDCVCHAGLLLLPVQKNIIFKAGRG